MAVLVARADGNFTAAATWGVVDATSLLDNETGNTALTTSYVESATFTPGAIEIDGIAVKVATRAASPSGTISVRLAQGGATVAGTEVTINVSDIESRAGEQGWYLFKFAAPVTLLAATVYTLSAKTSVATQVNLYRDATAANWARLLRTTTTAAPAAGDSFHILGEYTAAATKTDRTVTMDSTAATDYGNGTAISLANPSGATVGKGGILTCGTAAATNYVLRLSTTMTVWQGGILNYGTTVTPVPRDSSAVLEFDQISADGDYGLDVYGTCNFVGLSRTAGIDVVQCLLNTDEAAGQTTLGVDTETGWLSGDAVAISSTTRTASQHETRILNGNAGASSFDITVALTNAHSGTSPTQAEVILLTRNVKVRSTSSTLMAYVHVDQAATALFQWTEFRYLGVGTVGERGIEIETTSAGSCAIHYCSCYDFDSHGIYIFGTSADNVAISNTVIYNCATSTSDAGVHVASSTTGTNCSFTDITVIDSAGNGMRFVAVPGPVTRLRAGSCGSAGLCISSTRHVNFLISGVVAHSGNAEGINLERCYGGRIDDVVLWRNFGRGLTVTDASGVLIDGGTVFGNASSNLYVVSTLGMTQVHFRSLACAGDTTFSTAAGLELFANSKPITGLVLENCTFGSASGIFTTHTGSDIELGAASRFADITLRNVLMASATEIANSSQLVGKSAIRYQRVNQATGVHKVVYPVLGTVSLDTGTFRTAAPSEGMAPTGATAGLRLRSSIKRVPVESGATVAVSVYVRKDSSYNGNAARLVLLSNSAVGIDDDLVLATHSAAADTWQQLSGSSTPVAEEDGVLEFVVECDGSAGNVFVDDWSAA